MPIAISWQGATLGANTFTGAQVAPSLALGGASLGSNVLAVMGSMAISGAINASSNVLAGVSSYVGFTGSTLIGAPTDGNLVLINNAGGSFGRLQFGGTTASFPSLVRNGTTLGVRFADNSDDAPFSAASYAIGNAGLGVSWVGRSQIKSSADGNLLLLNNAASDFSLLQLGGTTSSFPAIKRYAYMFQFRTADDSVFVGVELAHVRYQNRTVAQLGTASGTGGGSVVYVTDATATTSRSVLAGGGANKVMAWSDGTNWLIF